MSNIIFGPVNSRRFGNSLGIDLSPLQKQCNFDCLYCELQGAKTVAKQQQIIPFVQIKEELDKALSLYQDIDVITITANGEPTLYPYLEELVAFLQTKAQKKLILTNSATITDRAVQKVLHKLDIVKLSLDCISKSCFKKLDRAHKDIAIEKIVEGIIDFSKSFANELIIEILFVKDINDTKKEIALLNEVLKQIKPARVDIGTIDRPPAYDVKALAYEELQTIQKLFDPILPINIAARKKALHKAQSYTKQQLLNTLSKRPFSVEETEVLFDKKTQEDLKQLLKEQKVQKVVTNEEIFYKATSNR